MKRLFDLLVSSIGLFLLIVPLIFIALLIRFKLGRPVLFRQMRPGLHGKPFMMYKFRTMSNECCPEGHLLPDSVRLHPFGLFLRTTSLDELPELWNVFRGEMSLVGPRPLLLDYLHLYSTEEARRHNVLPGITGWAQVNGRNAIGWDEKFKLDLWYVDNLSLWLDIKIFCLTIKNVLSRDGISAADEATMPIFSRNKITHE